MANNNTFYNLVVDNERIGAKNCGSGLASQRHRPARCHRGGRHRGAGAKYCAPTSGWNAIDAIALSVRAISGGGGGR